MLEGWVRGDSKRKRGISEKERKRDEGNEEE